MKGIKLVSKLGVEWDLFKEAITAMYPSIELIDTYRDDSIVTSGIVGNDIDIRDLLRISSRLTLKVQRDGRVLLEFTTSSK
jgi:hypothetical protein